MSVGTIEGESIIMSTLFFNMFSFISDDAVLKHPFCSLPSATCRRLVPYGTPWQTIHGWSVLVMSLRNGSLNQLLGVAVNQWISRILLDFILLGKKYIKQYNWITLEYMYFTLTPKKIIFQSSMYVYFTSKSTKDLVLKIETITYCCILDNQESFIEIPHLYMDRKDHTRWKIYALLCLIQKISKKEGGDINT